MLRYITTLTTCLVLLTSGKLYNPVIMIPGYGGSQGWSKIGQEDHHLWLNLLDMSLSEKYFYELSLSFDTRTNRTQRKAGPESVVFPCWGDTKYSDNLGSYFKYFQRLTESLQSFDSYYVRGYTLRGAPYDFRKDPKDNAFFVTSLMSLVEETYRLGYNRKVILVSHSMGCIYTNYFLNEMTTEWKTKFLAGWIPISGPFGGVVKSLVGSAIGESFIPLSDPRPSRKALRTCSSTHLLFPNELAFKRDQVFIRINDIAKKITMDNFREFYRLLDMDHMYPYYEQSVEITKLGASAPEGVKVLCIFSNGYQTNVRINYPRLENFFNADEYTFETEDSDGTVNWDSLMVCTKWNNTKTIIINDYNHLGILNAGAMLDAVKNFILDIN